MSNKNETHQHKFLKILYQTQKEKETDFYKQLEYIIKNNVFKVESLFLFFKEIPMPILFDYLISQDSCFHCFKKINSIKVCHKDELETYHLRCLFNKL